MIIRKGRVSTYCLLDPPAGYGYDCRCGKLWLWVSSGARRKIWRTVAPVDSQSCCFTQDMQACYHRRKQAHDATALYKAL